MGMKKEEAIEMVEAAFDVWESECYTENDWSEQYAARNIAIKAIKQKDVLDKIRAEIMTMSGDVETIYDVLVIFDKYTENI